MRLEGPVFATILNTIANDAVIDIARSGIKVHPILGIEKRFSQPLKNTFRKTKFQWRIISQTVASLLYV